MNKNDFLSALKQALSGLPEDERKNVLQYYEDYFLDAEGQSEEQVIADLGDPHKIAADIIKEYQEIQPHRNQFPPHTPRWKKGINPWLLFFLVLFAIPIGVPLAIAALALAGSLIVTFLAVLLCIVFAIVILPFTSLIVGISFVVSSFILWGSPATAIMTMGMGLIFLALGGLTACLFFRLCVLFIPPIFRWFIALLRWPIQKLRGVLR